MEDRCRAKRDAEGSEKGLYDANGNLETMPSQLYGARCKT